MNREEIYDDDFKLVIDVVKIVFSLFTDGKIKVDESALNRLEVNCNEVNFSISQHIGHASVFHTPIKFELKESFVENINDIFTLLLLSYFDNDKLISLPGFYGVFSKKFKYWDSDSESFWRSDFYKKKQALSALRLLQGAVDCDRIRSQLTDSVLYGASLINVESFGEKKTLRDVFCEKYLAPYVNDDREIYVKYFRLMGQQAYTKDGSKFVGLSYVKLNDKDVKLFFYLKILLS